MNSIKDAYIRRIIDSMDLGDMMAFVYDTIDNNLNAYSEKQLLDEIKENYPDIIEDCED